MAVTSEPSKLDTLLSPPPPSAMDPSPSSTSRSSSASDVPTTDSNSSPDRVTNDISTTSPSNPQRDANEMALLASRTEEYRQLFRLSAEEVLVQDYNCALQENILLQGHMYVFTHYICFYSNIFGFETKKIIPFQEITSIKKANTAGIFPTAIDIIAGGKKHFFASFLSRDQAFKLLYDGWMQYDSGAKEIADQQESVSRSDSQERVPIINKVKNDVAVHEIDCTDRVNDVPPSNNYEPSQLVEDEDVPITLSQQSANSDQDIEQNGYVKVSSSSRTWTWDVENVDAPEIPKSYTKVAETKFPLKVQEFFNLFFSDDAVPFAESFHNSCGDKEFRCSSWYRDEKFGHVRDVSFQHPIKIYFGAKCGSCQEVQKFRVFKNSHLVIETSQEVNDVPYGDYFRVEGLWDVVRDDGEANGSCFLRVYVNVNFSKKTVFKGKIVQSTLEECREAYGIWINMAHDLLKQKNLEKPEEGGPVGGIIQKSGVLSEKKAENNEAAVTSNQSEKCSTTSHMSTARSNQLKECVTTSQLSDSEISNSLQEKFMNATSVVPLFGEYISRFCAFLKSQNQMSLLLVVAFAMLFLMQMSIVVLLNRPQIVHVSSPENYYMSSAAGSPHKSAEAVAWLERRMHHLKDEIYMVEAQLDRLQREHKWLKSQLRDIDSREKHK